MRSSSILATLTFTTVYLGSSSAQSNITYGSVRPVLAINFPDPALVNDDGVWYAFSTSGNNRNIQVAASPNFLDHNWRLLNDTDVLPDPGPWAINEGGNIWAPDVIRLEDSRWIIYYAAPSKDDRSKHCVGAATSSSILGPYEPTKEPLACPLEYGGAIDPDAFVDPKSGKMYVVYKIDGNSLNVGGGLCNANPQDGINHPTPIMLQEVNSSDGMTKIGHPVQLLDRGDTDGVLVEAPSLFYNEDSDLYFLTFSSNCYATEHYDISFAYSTCLDGEFVKSKYPLMTTTTGPVTAPGGADMTPDGKYALYHGTVEMIGNDPVRYLFAAEADQAGTDMTAIPFS